LAFAYCEQRIEHPTKTHLILISDLYEGGDAKSMLTRVAAPKQSGVIATRATNSTVCLESAVAKSSR
jgi:hypothetical protein